MAAHGFTGRATTRCKICGGDAEWFGSADFNRSCEDRRGPGLQHLGVAINYNRCLDCGFLFTTDFDHWSRAEFKKFVYNDQYGLVDPDYFEVRPASNAKMVAGARFDIARDKIRVLDYGGGNGAFARHLRSAGFVNVQSYDPFNPEYSKLPDTKFDLVASFETLEHHVDPLFAVTTIAGLLNPDGVVLFSTLVQPPEFDLIGMSWWYVAPRNGHVSLFSEKSLALAWRRCGLDVKSFSPGIHAALNPEATSRGELAAEIN